MGRIREMLTGQTEPEQIEVNQPEVTEALPAECHNLSFYTITRTEDQKYLRGMLDSLPTGCEVVIVNTVHNPEQAGTLKVDRREDIAGNAFVLATYYYAAWDFSEARNAALSLCSRGWCFWMDTDDRLIPWQHGDIIDITNLPPGVAGVHVGCYGYQPPYEDGKRGIFYAVPHCRAHRNVPGLVWRGKVHEQIEAQIKDLGFTTVEADIGVYHVGYVTDVETMKKKMGRNVVMLCQQIATDWEYLPDYYTTTLRNNINTYLEMKGQ